MIRSDTAIKAKLFRGLADPSRLGVIEALRDGPLSVTEAVSRTGLTQPNVSMHLTCLADCGLVTKERQGKFVYYQIADKRVVKVLDQVEELLGEVGDLIGACPQYRSAGRRPRGQGRRKASRWRRRERRSS